MITQEEIAATLAGELDMHLEDLTEGGDKLAVTGYAEDMGGGAPTVTYVGPADGDTFFVETSTGQRYRVIVTEEA